MDVTRPGLRCPRCGRLLPADAPEGLCAACLLSAGTETLTQSSGGTPTVLSGSLPADAPTVLSPLSASTGLRDAPRLEPGQRFGPYQIHHLLGRGGMGEVYEAEHVDTGRRLALKVLRGRLHDAEDRARFLHEGQLAASVSHPHTVYIFGSEEIAGVPVISMELLPRGTLKDRVVARGPLPPTEAVSAVLDIIGGLDAAQAAGILHRDIKPSNCFTDADGTVKVGDFGLSISTLARDVRTTAAPQGFQGTPQFAPPEQMRGEPLDVRADIYAVGATLFYLLTGEAPFEVPPGETGGGEDLRVLVDRVMKEPPRSPRALRKDVPAGLSAIVLRCLAKNPTGRPASYAALAEALRPFSLADVQPGRLGPRLVAGLIDAIIIGLPVAVWNMWQITPDAPGRGTSVRIDAWTWLIGFTYYVVLEGATGASIGKRLFGLCVRTTSGPAPWSALALRTALFYLSTMPFLIPVMLFGQARVSTYLADRPTLAIVASLSTISLTLALFATARRRNGYAAVHDLLSRTRVTRRVTPSRRRATAAETTETPRAPSSSLQGLRCGPFDVIGDLGSTDTGRLLGGFDALLRRAVWIHAVPNGTPPVSPARRDVGRTGRLHWLTGRRSPGENWDAYEAPPGEPVTSIAHAPAERAWPVAKAWLTDLAAELAASEREGTVPPLGLDRVWIRSDGHAVVLDFPAPSPVNAPRPPAELMPVQLLGSVARHALASGGTAHDAGRTTPSTLPLSAVTLIDQWTRSPNAPIDEARTALAAAAGAPDRVPRWRRAVPIALAAAPVAILLAGSLAAVPLFLSSVTPERMEMYRLLDDLLEEPGPGKPALSDEERRAIEIYLAGRHGATLRDQAFWSGPVAQGQIKRLAEPAARIAAAHPAVSADELARATALLTPRLGAARERYETTLAPTLPRAAIAIIGILATVSLAIALICSIVSAMVSPGGVLFRPLGLAVVTRSGREITRARSLLRVLLAWSPAIVWFAWLGVSPVERLREAETSPLLAVGVTVGILAAGAIWTLARPTRGPHDMVAGTWVVPR